MIGFCMSIIATSLVFSGRVIVVDRKYIDKVLTQREREREFTSLQEAMASITSFVNVFPTPDDPIRIVGFIT